MFDTTIDWHEFRPREEFEELIGTSNLDSLLGNGVERNEEGLWAVDGDYAVVRWDHEDPARWTLASVVGEHLGVSASRVHRWRILSKSGDHDIEVYKLDSFDFLVPSSDERYLYKVA